VNAHAQLADAAWTQAERGGEDEVGAIGLEKVGGADVGLEALGNEGDNVHQRFGRLAFLARQIADFVEGQDIAAVRTGRRLLQILNIVVILVEPQSRKWHERTGASTEMPGSLLHRL